MKKTTLLTMMASALLLVSCASVSKVEKRTPTKAELVGSWSCKTVYEDFAIGMVDLIDLNADGTMSDESYIFDNSVKKMTGVKTKNYFRSPFKYLRESSGNWKLDKNHLVYSLKMNSVKRLIFADVFKELQKTKELREYEKNIFNIYSSDKSEEPIEFDFVGFTKNGFIVNQKLDEKNYKSHCIKKEKAEPKLHKRLAIYKMLAEKRQAK